MGSPLVFGATVDLLLRAHFYHLEHSPPNHGGPCSRLDISWTGLEAGRWAKSRIGSRTCALLSARINRRASWSAPRLVVGVVVASLALTAPGTVGASPPSDTQANEPQVAGSSPTDVVVFPTNKSNEPTIAVDARNPNVLLAGANDEQQQPPCGPGPVRGSDAPANDCSFFPWVGTSGLYRSLDGGSSWRNLGMIDDYWSTATKTPERGIVSDGDPVIVIGPLPLPGGGFSRTQRRGLRDAWAASKPAKGFEYVILTYSDDFASAGRPTWKRSAITTTKTSAADFNDKNWIGVDDNPQSPFFGRVYVSWTEFRSATATGNGNEPMMVSSSTDGGRTFGSPKQLSPAGNNGTGNGRQGSSIATGPDGTVYVAFEQGSDQAIVVSRDGHDMDPTASDRARHGYSGSLARSELPHQQLRRDRRRAD